MAKRRSRVAAPIFMATLEGAVSGQNFGLGGGIMGQISSFAPRNGSIIARVAVSTD
jgi:hypothetical protein